MITINGNALTNTIRNLCKILDKRSPEIVTLSSDLEDKNCVVLRGYSEGRFVSLQEPAKITSQFKFGIPVDRFLPLFTGRDSMQLNVDGNTLSYKAVEGHYSGNMSLEPYREIKLPDINSKKALSLSEPLKVALFELFEYIEIHSLFITKEMVEFIEIDNKRLIVAAADNHHLGMVEHTLNTKATPSLTTSFPFRYQPLIFLAFGKNSASVNILIDRMLHMFSETVQISLPMIDSSDDINLSGIKKLFRTSKETKKSAIFTIDAEAIKLAMMNMTGIRDREKDKGTELSIKVSGKTAALKMESRHGAVNDRITIENNSAGEAELLFDPTILNDVLEHLDGRITMSFIGNHECLIEKRLENNQISYLMKCVSSMGKPVKKVK